VIKYGDKRNEVLLVLRSLLGLIIRFLVHGSIVAASSEEFSFFFGMEKGMS